MPTYTSRKLCPRVLNKGPSRDRWHAILHRPLISNAFLPRGAPGTCMCLFRSPPPQTQQEMTEETGPWAGRSLATCSWSQQLTFHLHGNLTMLLTDWRAAPEDASCLNTSLHHQWYCRRASQASGSQHGKRLMGTDLVLSKEQTLTLSPLLLMFHCSQIILNLALGFPSTNKPVQQVDWNI